MIANETVIVLQTLQTPQHMLSVVRSFVPIFLILGFVMFILSVMHDVSQKRLNQDSKDDDERAFISENRMRYIIDNPKAITEKEMNQFLKKNSTELYKLFKDKTQIKKDKYGVTKKERRDVK